MNKRVMLIANSASMIDHFNKDNIKILQEMGYSIVVAANFRDGNSSTKERISDFEKELSAQGIDIIDLPIPRNVTQLSSTFKSINKLKKYLKKNPCCLIHTQTPFGGVVGRLAAKKFRKKGETKVLYYVHGFHFFKGAPTKNYIIYYNIEKILSRYTDCLITLNNEDFNAARRKFQQTDVRYVAGVGVDTSSIANHSIDVAAKKNELGIPEDKIVILNVSELIPRKNVKASIKAFAKSKNKNSVLLICGKGALSEELKELAEQLGVKDRVYFLGYRTDILDIYNISDIFMFSSYQEGLSVAMMQAMATGLPIIASDIRGNNDLLLPYTGCESGDFLVSTDNVSGYTKKLDLLIDNPDLRAKIGALNQKNCSQYFDIKIVHEQMKNIYNNLLNN